MEFQSVQLIAGSLASFIFISGSFSMVWKAFSTRELSSYSLGQIGLSNGGNLIFWLYVAGLPIGPIWLLHGFNTLVAALMLFWYLRYETDLSVQYFLQRNVVGLLTKQTPSV